MSDRLNTALPIEQLVVNASNARKEHDTDPTLVASIAAAGLMYPITVKAIAPDKFEVIDGARRLYAIKSGIASGLIDMERVPVKILENGLDSLEYSLHGNLHMAMHPLDEADAIAKLSKKDEDKTTIAARFGKTVLWVDQRARLSKLIPEVKLLFREREIDLETAMAFTLADDKLQKQIVKAHQYDSPGQVRRMATQTKVNAKEAIFPLESWPDDKIERDLFSDDVWLTSIPLFLKKQAEAFDAKVAEYKAKGYHEVIVLKHDDWQTPNRYAQLKGTVSNKQRGQLTVLLQMAENGKVRAWEDMLPNKEAKKVQSSTHGHDTVNAEDVKPKRAKDFSNMQLEQMAAQATSALFMQIVEGSPPEALLQYIVYSVAASHQVEPWGPANCVGGHTERRRKSIEANHKIPHGVVNTQTPAGMSYAKWLADRTPAARKQLYLEAIARMLHYAGPVEAEKAIKTIPVKGWFKPDEQFFSRYRSDQLEDYIRKCGNTAKSHEGLKKAELVKMALSVSKEKGAWQP